MTVDKIEPGYLELYEPFFAPLTSHAIQLLELGVKEGESRNCGAIISLEVELLASIDGGLAVSHWESAFRFSKGDQADTEFRDQTALDGFDVIIGDASHIGQLTKTTFWHLFDHHLKPGGLYAIEDWGTGYLDDRDGKRFKPNPSILQRVQSFLSRRLTAKSRSRFRAMHTAWSVLSRSW